MPIYRVTATALNLRSQPNTGGAVVGVVPQGGLISVSDPVPDAAGWLAGSWQSLNGFVKASFLEPVGESAAASSGAPAPAPSASSIDVARRNTRLECLHPEFRRRAQRVLDALRAEHIPFALFEGYRPPERQAHLFRKGRDSPGAKVTNAQAWSSYHQYGLAGDFVLLLDKGWSWDTSGVLAGHWRRLHEVGTSEGLEALSFEMPHLQVAGLTIADLRSGLYPPGGDGSWIESLQSAIDRWAGPPKGPPGMGDRPPLTS